MAADRTASAGSPAPGFRPPRRRRPGNIDPLSLNKPMSALKNICEYVGDRIEHPGEVALLSAGILAGEILSRTKAPDMVVHGDDPFVQQMKMALPSALPTPEMVGNRGLDTALHIAMSAASLEAVRRNTSRCEVIAGALGAQMLACLANAAVERSGWLTPQERAHRDVGFSAVFASWLTKRLVDKFTEAQSGREKLGYAGLMAAGAGTILAGAKMEDGRGGKLDLVAHASGTLAGWLFHRFGDACRTSASG